MLIWSANYGTAFKMLHLKLLQETKKAPMLQILKNDKYEINREDFSMCSKSFCIIERYLGKWGRKWKIAQTTLKKKST